MRNVRRVAIKLVELIIVVFCVTAITFLLLNLLPGSPALSILGVNATPHAVAQLDKTLNLNHPLPVRYADWMGQILRGNFGTSEVDGQPVAHAILQHLPVTLELLILCQLMAFVVAIPAGIWAGYRKNSWIDRLTTGGSFALLAFPPFIVALLFVYVFAVRWHAFPATGFTSISAGLFSNLRTMFLPAFTLALGSVAIYVRVLRSEIINVLEENYITAARAKGMPSWWILLRHAFRPSTFSLVTVAGINIGLLIGGSFIVEQIFALPGIGLLTVDAIFSRDYITVQGCILVVAVGFVVINFIVDLLYPVLDPRVRDQRIGRIGVRVR
jgi:peptide/nickel transport system permease protein